jgi:hypothetical protein
MERQKGDMTGSKRFIIKYKASRISIAETESDMKVW